MVKIEFGNKDNSILIGAKPFIHYVKAIEKQFMLETAKQIIIKARGKFISKSVDVAEISKRKLQNAIRVKQTKISTEDFTTESGKKISVSTIEIVMGK